MRRLALVTLACLSAQALAARAVAESGHRAWSDPAGYWPAHYEPPQGPPSCEDFLPFFCDRPPRDLASALADAFPGVAISVLHAGAAPDWRAAPALAIPLLGVVLLAWAWIAGAGRASRRDAAWKVALVGLSALALGAGGWLVAPSLWDARWAVPHEGNSGRTLAQFYALFHSEPLRTGLVAWLRWATGAESLPPVAVTARLTLASLGASFPLLVAAARTLGAGPFLSFLGIGLALASPAVSQYALTDHPIGGIALFTGLGFLALQAAWHADEFRVRLASATALLCFQGMAAALRPETLVLWLLPDAAIAAAWSRGLTPAAWSDGLGAGVRAALDRMTASPRGRTLLGAGIFAMVAFPALAVRLPFLLAAAPRAELLFPFMLPTALWGGFVAGLMRMADWMAPAALLLIAGGLAFGLLRSIRARGMGLALAGLLSGWWFLCLAHPDHVFIRLSVSAIPAMALLGIQAIAAMDARRRTVACAFLAALTALLPLLGSQTGGAGWTHQVVHPPVRQVDNAFEAHEAYRLIVDSEGGCVVAPVLSAERPGSAEVPLELRRLDLLVLQADRAFRVHTGTRDPDAGRLYEQVRAAGAACDGARVYLGLDCAIRGMTFCDGLRTRLDPQGGLGVDDAPAYAAADHYGRRDSGRYVGSWALPGARRAGPSDGDEW